MTADVRDQEQARRDAMIAADVDTLDTLFHPELRWVHATGRTDDKAGILGTIGSGATKYRSIEVSDEEIRVVAETAYVSGTAAMTLETAAGTKDLLNRFVIAWVREGEAFRAVHWQSTPLKA